MKITSVESQKKNPRRFNIFLDGQFAFGADEDTVVNKRLLVGKQLNAEDLEKVLFETEVGKLMERMYGLFSIRMRTEKEVRDYLKNLNFKRKIKEQEQFSDLVIEATVESLKRKELLNDLVFAKSWMEARRNSKQKGRQAIKAELYQKGVARDIVEQVLEEGDEGSSEKDLATLALEKKARTWKNLEEPEFKQKALEFLIRRGFEYSLAKEVIENFFQKE